MNAERVWECGQCLTTYISKIETQECCAPPVRIVYICSECETSFSTEKEADECGDLVGHNRKQMITASP